MLLSLLLACSSPAPTRFTLLSPEATGVHFANQLQDTRTFNILNYLYYYNGGGVAIGDLNGDSLPDLYFSANLLPNRLYLNRGNFQFEDISARSGTEGKEGWKTGVTMADVNGDGLLDIYVCYLGEYLDKSGRNELYINNGDLTFTERAAEYGLDLKGFCTQAVFFDYDRDQDLDCFVLHHSVNPAGMVGPASQRLQRDPLAGDKLLRNDGGTFTDVSEQAGIYGSRLGYGLSVAAGDLDLDGWTDLYICNDFHEDDYFYRNQGDGSFREELREHFGHTSRFSMGSDLADFNNDALPDLITLDMKPRREDILKTAESPEPYKIFQTKRSFGYYYQYPRNALQLNRGDGTFSEIGQLAGVDASDWSWSALWMDADLDGRKDLFITNGILRRPNDMDYLKFTQQPEVARALQRGPSEEDLKFITRMPSVRLASFGFRNEGGYAFSDQSAAWGLDQPAFSNGSAYADLDLDGDLDWVLNNLQEPAFLYRNESRQDTGLHFLHIRFGGEGGNRFGIGAKVWLWTQGSVQYQELQPVRGFLSSVEPALLFGLGAARQIDSLRVAWPSGKVQRLYGLRADQRLWLREQEAAGLLAPAAPPALWPVAAQQPLPFIHQENAFSDFDREPLMPHHLSSEGPRMAAADANGDGRSDVYVCGAAGQRGCLLLQQADGSFRADSLALGGQNPLQEETAAAWLDADGDGDPDLYVACGGNQAPRGHPLNRDRLYFNDGQGRFRLREEALPDLSGNSGCVAAADLDGDGDPDLFCGERSIPGAYGLPAKAWLLLNDGEGTFREATASHAPYLMAGGMYSAALWQDDDLDGDPDLFVAGEWMPLLRYENLGGKLAAPSAGAGLDSSEGWWNSLHSADLDGDGDPDLLAGNLGRNSLLKASPQEPCRLQVADFDRNGASDPVISYYKEGKSYPIASRDELLGQMPALRRRFPTYAAYSQAKTEDLFSEDELQSAHQAQARCFASCWFENLGGGRYRRHELPAEAQFAPIYAFAAWRSGEEGTYVFCAGGQGGVGPGRGRYDALSGLLLRLRPGQPAEALPPTRSGFFLPGETRSLLLLEAGRQPCLLAARNNSQAMLFTLGPVPRR